MLIKHHARLLCVTLCNVYWLELDNEYFKVEPREKSRANPTFVFSYKIRKDAKFRRLQNVEWKRREKGCRDKEKERKKEKEIVRVRETGRQRGCEREAEKETETGTPQTRTHTKK